MARLIPTLLACYLIGSIPFGLLAGRLIKRVDIRDYGSGNIGATNVLRTLGLVPAILVFLLDTAKGFFAVKLCEALLPESPAVVVAGALLAVAGHTLSVFLRFKGGKGVATTLGVILGFDPLTGAIAFGVWAVIVGITRYISVASIVASITVPLVMHFWKALDVPAAYQLTAAVAALAIIVKHKPNMQRLLKGTESRIGQRVKLPNNTEGPK